MRTYSRLPTMKVLQKKTLNKLGALPSSKVKIVDGRSMVWKVVKTDLDRVCLFELSPLFSQPHSPIGSFSSSLLRPLIAKKSS